MRLVMLELHAGVHISNKEVAVQPNFAIHNVKNFIFICSHKMLLKNTVFYDRSKQIIVEICRLFWNFYLAESMNNALE